MLSRNGSFLLDCLAISCAKAAGDPGDGSEDAHAIDLSTGRIAVSDGAGQSPFSGEWAQLLVDNWSMYSGSPGRWHRNPPQLEPAWRDAVADWWQDNGESSSLPVYLQEELRHPEASHATFLGLRFRHPSWWRSLGGYVCCWTAVAVGDTCLFQVRDDRLLSSFPCDRAGQFGRFPPLVTTAGTPSTRRRNGGCKHDDRLYLMTDALAEWFLVDHERGRRPWHILDGLDRATFTGWLEELRGKRAIRDDDVTLVRVAVRAADP